MENNDIFSIDLNTDIKPPLKGKDNFVLSERDLFDFIYDEGHPINKKDFCGDENISKFENFYNYAKMKFYFIEKDLDFLTKLNYDLKSEVMKLSDRLKNFNVNIITFINIKFDLLSKDLINLIINKILNFDEKSDLLLKKSKNDFTDDNNLNNVKSNNNDVLSKSTINLENKKILIIWIVIK